MVLTTAAVAASWNATDAVMLRAVRDHVVAAGIPINGLPIFGDPRVNNLSGYCQANVSGGPNSFMIVAQSFDTFAIAIEELAERSLDWMSAPSLSDK